MLARLTDNYRKDPDSNIGKLLNVVAGEIEEVQTALEATESYRDIDQAAGATLDRIGLNAQQYRGVANDDMYRILIKSRLARNLSTGDMNTIIKVLAITLGVAESEIKVTELHALPVNPEPAAIFLRFPPATINAAGLSANQFGRMISRVVAAGVRADISIEGTFAFSANPTESEYDNPEGLDRKSVV